MLRDRQGADRPERFDAMWPESFWAAAPQPELRIERWELESLRHRTGFWQEVIERLAAIGDNRLSKDERVAVRRAIHKVVPWVMEPERKRLVVLEAQREYASIRMGYEWAEKDVARDQEAIKHHTESLKKNQDEICQVGSSRA